MRMSTLGVDVLYGSNCRAHEGARGMAHARDDAREHMPSGSADDGREVEHLSARAGIATKTMLSRMNCDSIVSPSKARYILSPPFVRRLHHSVSI